MALTNAAATLLPRIFLLKYLFNFCANFSAIFFVWAFLNCTQAALQRPQTRLIRESSTLALNCQSLPNSIFLRPLVLIFLKPQ